MVYVLPNGTESAGINSLVDTLTSGTPLKRVCGHNEQRLSLISCTLWPGSDAPGTHDDPKKLLKI